MAATVSRMLAVLVVASTAGLVAPAGAQVPLPSRQTLEALADKGDGTGVWAGWNQLTASRETLRLGVDLAARLRDVPRGLDIYNRLRGESSDPESDALRALALATATGLAAVSDADARAIGCAAALRLDPTHRACLAALESMADRGQSAGEILLGAYALAEAGLRWVPPFPDDVGRLLTPSYRLHLARQFRDLPVSERLALIRPLLGHQDQAYRYQTILLAAFIDDGSTAALIEAIEPASTPIRVARLVTLAALGHVESVDAVRGMYDGLDDYSKILAGLALARVGDARGSNVLDQSLRSPNELTRNTAAELVLRLNPTAVVTPILDGVGRGSAVGRAGATRVAGLAGLGTSLPVYRQLEDTDALVRAETIGAIARTLRAEARQAPRQP